MTIRLDPDLTAILSELASRQGVSPEALALKSLHDQFVAPATHSTDEWERLLASVGSDCGVSLSNEALSSDGLYD